MLGLRRQNVPRRERKSVIHEPVLWDAVAFFMLA